MRRTLGALKRRRYKMLGCQMPPQGTMGGGVRVGGRVQGNQPLKGGSSHHLDRVSPRDDAAGSVSSMLSPTVGESRWENLGRGGKTWEKFKPREKS